MKSFLGVLGMLLACTAPKYQLVTAATVEYPAIAVTHVQIQRQEPATGYMGVIAYAHIGTIAPADGTLVAQLKAEAARVGANRVIPVTGSPLYRDYVGGLAITPIGAQQIAVRSVTWPTYTGVVFLYRVTDTVPRVDLKRTLTPR